MSELARVLPGIKKLSGQLNYRKWSLSVRSAAEFGDCWDAIIGEDEAISDSKEHERDLKKRERKARGLITSTVIDTLQLELDELKGDQRTTTSGTGVDTKTTVSYTEPKACELWNHLRVRFEKKDGVSAILDFHQFLTTRFTPDGTLGAQFNTTG